MIEEIGEEIDVIARFQGGKITPVKFRWTGETYFVVRVPSVLATSGDVFEMRLDSQRMRWVLDKVRMEG